mgnify:CR=1 FL=1
MKFKRGQLASFHAGPRRRAAPCIVLEHVLVVPVVWYRVYIIEQQLTTYFRENILSPINPQEAENEV